MTSVSRSQEAPAIPAVLAALISQYEARFPDAAPDQAPPAIPFFPFFADAGTYAAVKAFACDWGDAQAAEDWHAGRVADPDGLTYQGEIEAGLVLTRGEACTDDVSSFIYAFAHAWADGYTDRVIFAEARGW